MNKYAQIYLRAFNKVAEELADDGYGGDPNYNSKDLVDEDGDLIRYSFHTGERIDHEGKPIRKPWTLDDMWEAYQRGGSDEVDPSVFPDYMKDEYGDVVHPPTPTIIGDE